MHVAIKTNRVNELNIVMMILTLIIRAGSVFRIFASFLQFKI